MDERPTPSGQPAANPLTPTDPAKRPGPDRLPGRRDALPEGALGGMPTDPTGDENREPPQNAPTKPA
ncbi:MAG: hypothetical protein J0H67_06600 [Rhodospirillales bacterium]|nr:hypothetical protein [Rhodospirillales bacterium]